MPVAAIIFAAALRLTVDPRPLATFDPQRAFGATVDAHDQGETPGVFNAANVTAMRSAGFHTLSYRLATELAGEAWHWNPRGTWSDPAHQCGYWTSSDDLAQPITESYGYRLPRRGNTLDQFHRDDYSRIDDGDPATFWKSNPYLAARPQWFLVDLGSEKPVRTIRIVWGEPFAVDFRVERWTGDDPLNNPSEGRWEVFPTGSVYDNTAHKSNTILAGLPIRARFVRVLMTRSSRSGPSSADWRDREGFAVAEVSIDAHVRHGPSRTTQSIIWVSSTDPWHRASDIDHSIEQPGLDLIYSTGLTESAPMLTPVALLYGTPDDAAAELRYLRRRGYRVTRVEMGEEPDGQAVLPEDYAELYEQWANVLKDVALGGPAFQSTVDIVAAWRDGRGSTSWIGRFLDVLRERGRLRDFAFFSFEWYPFDNACLDPRAQLAIAPALLRSVIDEWRKDGLPRDVPMLATEYGWSSYAAEPEVRFEAALFNTGFVADFLSMGGEAAYFYGLEPNGLMRELSCPDFGNLILFLGDSQFRIRSHVPAYWGAWLMTHAWCQPSGTHTLHAVHGSTNIVRAFAVTRPDGSRALMILNQDPNRSFDVLAFEGELCVDRYSSQQFSWRANGELGYALRDDPPEHFVVRGSIQIPPDSITIVSTR